MPSIRLSLLALALTVSACSSSGGGAQSASSRPAPRNPDLITGDQIQDAIVSGLGNAYDLVMRLHPSWMTTTGSRAVQVWMDNQRLGNVTTLRAISLTTLSAIRYMGPSEAQGQLGLNNQGGAIVLTTVR